MEESRNILTVTELNEYIKHLIDSTPFLARVHVKGEISNFTNHYKTGHFYFTLKDSEGLIRAVMFKSSAAKLRFVPENGMKVILTGRVSAFVRDGQYQIYAEEMEPDGIGALYIAYEQLKKRLEAEGLFAESIKRPIPKIPTRIGIITSPTGAAVRDMINITGRRFPYAKLILYPSLVQGDGAAAQLISGIEYFGASKNVDVIIIGRGGGSIEDLWAFNDEGLARAIRKCGIPVISAVGHETDFTICDFAADKRAPTPSAAAELAVPETVELKRKLLNVNTRMEMILSGRIGLYRKSLENMKNKRALTSPEYFIDDKRLALLNDSRRLETASVSIVNQKKAEYKRLTSLLDAVNPLKIISRGYSAVFDKNGTLIKSVDDIGIGEVFSFRTSDGSITGKVLEKNRQNEKVQ
ncbi:MAG: exodeoxyribonuclease VII large subunit [Firmicutes bacterium]|nr:exodeoxyribonuclease VII large subunit [Bacillota bacterium]